MLFYFNFVAQVPGICPGVPGYCSLDTTGALCTFDCAAGSKIRSYCTKDGTWEPYPTCDGDVRYSDQNVLFI